MVFKTAHTFVTNVFRHKLYRTIVSMLFILHHSKMNKINVMLTCFTDIAFHFRTVTWCKARYSQHDTCSTWGGINILIGKNCQSVGINQPVLSWRRSLHAKQVARRSFTNKTKFNDLLVQRISIITKSNHVGSLNMCFILMNGWNLRCKMTTSFIFE